ncbi:unnamed protein product [Rhizoctonia solani]|uniref:Protein kinase domain-containing protein n=1 Tax=Rhizoctonia solani TaxID=456999 RepID=A0A8H3D1T5_9AGAM|nr:unnamed protein product [Rhizoctonia solani]
MPIEANNPSTRESYERPAPPIEDKEPSTPSSRRLSPSNTHLPKILPHTTKLSAFHSSMTQFYPRNILLLPPEYATDNPILDMAMADIIKATRDFDINDTALMNVLLESLGHSELYVRPITRQWIVGLLEAASSKMAGTRGAGLWEIIVRISPERYFVCPRHMEGAVKCYVQMIDAVDKNSEAFIEEDLKARLSRIIQPEPPRVNIGVICTSCQFPMNLDTTTEATVTTATNGTSLVPLGPGRTAKKTHAPATGPDNAQQMPDPAQVSSNATTCDSFAPSTGPQSRYDEAACATVSSLIGVDPPSDTISHFALQASPLPPVSSRKRARPPSPALDPTVHSPSSKRAKTNSELQLPTEADGSVHTALYQLQGNYSEHPLENIDALGPNILDQVVGVQSVRSNEMTALGMFKCLTEHGCSDLRSLIDPNRFSSHRVAEGGFGDVWKGQLTDGTRVAVKVLRYGLIREDGSKSIKRATREIYNWSKLEHNNIHKLLGVTMFQERLGMVSIWMEHGTLQQYLNQRDDINRRELLRE